MTKNGVQLACAISLKIHKNPKYGSTNVRYNTKLQYENTYSDWAILETEHANNRYVTSN